MPTTTTTSRWRVWALIPFCVVIIGWLFSFCLTEFNITRIQQSELSTLSDDYNIVELSAPTLSGLPLKIFTHILTRVQWIRPFFFRLLLNQNGVGRIRTLAAKFPHLPPTYYPIRRLNQTEYNAHVEMASKETEFDTTTTTTSPLYWSVMDYYNVYKSGKATPLEVIERVLEGCEKLQHLKIFASFMKQDVLQQAQDSTRRWKEGKPLSIWDGVPYVSKDMVFSKPHPLCFGSHDCMQPDTFEDDDVLISKFRSAGAILLGTTSMTEGGVSPLGYSLLLDGPLNPYDEAYYPGGSSSGSAVAVATGLVPVAIGFDGGGSIRVPASMSGTVGLAATFGRIHFGDAGVTTIKSGPLAASVQDAALAYKLMSSSTTPQHWYGKMYSNTELQPPAHAFGMNQHQDLKGMKLGIFQPHFQHTDPEIVEKSRRVVKFLQEERGATIVNITIPHIMELNMAHGIHIVSEFALAWDWQFSDPDFVMEDSTRILLAVGREVTALEAAACNRVRSIGLQIFHDLFQEPNGIDAILSPTLGLKVPKPARWHRYAGESNTGLVYKTMRFIPLANFLGLPALSIPIGYEEETGLPIGFQLLGDAWCEYKLLRIAAAIESGYSRRRRPPPRNFYNVLEPFGQN